MNKIKIVAIALAAFVFCFAAACDNGTTGGSAGASSDEELFYGKWEPVDFPGSFYEYKSDGTWSYTYESRVTNSGTWYLEDYEGRSILVKWDDSGTPLIGHGYDYEFGDNGNEVHLNWLGNTGGNTGIPTYKSFSLKKIN